MTLSASILAVALAAGSGSQFKELYERGESLYEAGDYLAAVKTFRQADAIRATPEVAFDLAQSYLKLGDKAGMIHAYRVYLARSPHASDAAEISEKVKAALSREREANRGLVELEAPGATLAIVGRETFTDLPVAVIVIEGPTEVSVTFPTGVVHETSVVTAGEVTELSLKAPPVAVVKASDDWAADGSREEVSTSAPEHSRNVMRPASYVVLGVAAAALATGCAFGAMARMDSDRLNNERQAMSTPDAVALANSSNARGGLANMLWLGGGVAAAGGGAMFVFSTP